ncbi:PorT family protein [bacterium]|nr:PorT family protein [bacterium]
MRCSSGGTSPRCGSGTSRCRNLFRTLGSGVSGWTNGHRNFRKWRPIQNFFYGWCIGGASVDEHISIQAELNYIEKGYFRPSLLPVRDGASLKYLEVPLFLKARAHWNNLAPSLFAGPSIAYLHSATQVDSGVSFDKTSTTNRFEYGLYVGAGLDIILSQNLELGASVRYGWGLSSIEEAPQIAGVYNRVFHWVGNVKFRF